MSTKFKDGNQYYRLRKRDGRKRLYPTADDLIEVANAYFYFVESTPLLEDSIGWFEGSASHEDKKKMRAMTIQGLCNFMDISPSTWYEWKSPLSSISRTDDADFMDIVGRVENIIYVQKLEGSAAGLLNSSIIARELGLVDKHGIDGSLITKSVDIEDMTDEELLRTIELAQKTLMPNDGDGGGENEG